MSVSRTSILYAILTAALLAALPGAIRKAIQAGDPYLFTERFFQDVLARLSGPGSLRFIFQPTVAIFLGVRGGIEDAPGFTTICWGARFSRRAPEPVVAQRAGVHSRPRGHRDPSRYDSPIPYLSE